MSKHRLRYSRERAPLSLLYDQGSRARIWNRCCSRFWLSESVGDKCLTGSEQTTIKAMGYLYGGLDKSKIEEADLIAFLTKLRDAEEAPWMGQWLRQVIKEANEVMN